MVTGGGEGNRMCTFHAVVGKEGAKGIQPLFAAVPLIFKRVLNKRTRSCKPAI